MVVDGVSYLLIENKVSIKDTSSIERKDKLTGKLVYLFSFFDTG